ncbi:MAG: ORF6N domain-containing protein [Flavobacteriales bacterium]
MTDKKDQKEEGVAVAEEVIAGKIYKFREQKVMLDRDLAELYGVETKSLKRAVRRNTDRFPEDFMFELSGEEWKNLRHQFGTSSWGGTRYPPMAFTEQGIAMLSSVLHSDRAIKMNIQIMRVFTKMRQLITNYKELVERIENLEDSEMAQNEQIRKIYDMLREIMEPPQEARERIGFKREEEA